MALCTAAYSMSLMFLTSSVVLMLYSLCLCYVFIILGAVLKLRQAFRVKGQRKRDAAWGVNGVTKNFSKEL